jgi:hypothetical protein
MPGTNVIVPDSGNGAGRLYAFRGLSRQRMRGYALAGIALSGWVGFVLLAVFLALRPGGPPPDRGPRETGAPRVLVGPVIVAEPWQPTPFPIMVGPGPPRDGWIRISGVPALASLSAGHTIGRGVWKVPLAGLSTLTIMAPARDTLRSDVRIALMSPEGAVMTEVQSALAVIPPSLCGAAPSIRTGSLPDDLVLEPVKTPPSLSQIRVLVTDGDRRRAQELILLGEIQRMQGRFASARAYYRQAADMGSPRGAMALAATFDPHEIAGTTIAPDKEVARAWYRQSRDLMDAAVEFYLKRLER